MYINRGLLKSQLGDYNDAILDFDNAIEINQNDGKAYLNRGIAKAEMNDINGFCKDISKAINLGISKKKLKDILEDNCE